MHATDTYTYHVCGGTILTGTEVDTYRYCDRCGAFTFDQEGDLPSGADKEANREAWDAGEDSSP